MRRDGASVEQPEKSYPKVTQKLQKLPKSYQKVAKVWSRRFFELQGRAAPSAGPAKGVQRRSQLTRAVTKRCRPETGRGCHAQHPETRRSSRRGRCTSRPHRRRPAPEKVNTAGHQYPSRPDGLGVRDLSPAPGDLVAHSVAAPVAATGANHVFLQTDSGPPRDMQHTM